MSIRLRRSTPVVKSQHVSRGSLFSLAIDLKPTHLPSSGGEPVGVKIASGDKSDGSFVIKMYYGKIKEDPDVRLKVSGSDNDDQFYLRFRINYLDGLSSQVAVGNMIKNGVSSVLTPMGFEHVKMSTNTPHGGKRVHVCGNEVDSYFVQAFLKNTDAEVTPNFESIAKAIAGVGADKPFLIDDDAYRYSYKLNTTPGEAVMTVTRLPM